MCIGLQKYFPRKNVSVLYHNFADQRHLFRQILLRDVEESDLELARFLSIAAGSASETEYHILLACNLGFLEKKVYMELDKKINEIKRMLNSFIQHLKANT